MKKSRNYIFCFIALILTVCLVLLSQVISIDENISAYVTNVSGDGYITNLMVEIDDMDFSESSIHQLENVENYKFFLNNGINVFFNTVNVSVSMPYDNKISMILECISTTPITNKGGKLIITGVSTGTKKIPELNFNFPSTKDDILYQIDSESKITSLAMSEDSIRFHYSGDDVSGKKFRAFYKNGVECITRDYIFENLEAGGYDVVLTSLGSMERFQTYKLAISSELGAYTNYLISTM